MGGRAPRKGSCEVPSGYGVCLRPGGPVFLADAMQKVGCIVGLTAIRLAFFMGFE